MKYLLCLINFTNNHELFQHYVDYHRINERNYYFKQLSETDPNACFETKCYRCEEIFSRCRDPKNHNFLRHYQTGRRCPIREKPICILKRGNALTTYSKSVDQHSDFENFFNSEEIVDEFLAVVEDRFVPTENVESCPSLELLLNSLFFLSKKMLYYS